MYLTVLSQLLADLSQDSHSALREPLFRREPSLERVDFRLEIGGLIPLISD